MPMKLLDRISRETMPVEVTDFKDLFNIHILRAAGYIFASIPLSYYARDGKWHREPATILQITPLGRMVLRYFGSGNPNRVIEMARNDPLAFKALPQFAKTS